jgi:hypothetical protein
MTEDWKTPNTQVLVALASLVVHVDEAIETKHPLDLLATQGLMHTVKEWVDSVPDVLKPVKR